MADMQPQGGIVADLEDGPRHDTDEVSVRGIVTFALGLIAVGLVVHFLLGLIMQRYSRQEKQGQALTPPLFAVPVEVPAPRLQGDPGADRVRVQQAQLEILNSYGWVDRDAGIARIPIDRAMEILAKTGLPDIKGLPQPEAAALERLRAEPPAQPEVRPPARPRPEAKPAAQPKAGSPSDSGRKP